MKRFLKWLPATALAIFAVVAYATVTSETDNLQYSGNGSTTTFAYTWKVFEEDELQVALIQDSTGTRDLQTLTTEYSVTGEGTSTGGNVVFVTAPASGYTVDIRRVVDLTQPTDIRNLGAFYPEIHEDQFDRFAMQIQQLDRALDRTLKADDFGVAPDFDLGDAVSRANTYLTFDSNGDAALAASLPSGTLSQASITELLYPQTSAESSEGVTPTNYQYPAGWVERYGTNTVPGTTDMTSALQTAITLATDYGVRMRAEGGVYAITDTLDIDAFTPSVSATFEAIDRVRIILDDDTIPVADVGGRAMRWIGDWGFEHSSLPSSSNTNAVGWRINNYLAYSTFDSLRFTKNYAGWQPAQSGGFGGANTAFANTISNLYITQFSGLALDWDSAPSGGHTPSFIAGAYINNFQDDGTTKNETTTYPVQVKSGDSLVFGHLHVEHLIAPGIAETGSDAGALIVNALHIEGFEANAQTQLFSALTNSGMVINQLYMNYSNLEAATIGGNTFGLFRVSPGAQIIVQRLYETNNTVDITDWIVARSASADSNSAVWVNSGVVTTSAGGNYTTILQTASSAQDLVSSVPSILRRWLGIDRFHDYGSETLTGTATVSLDVLVSDMDSSGGAVTATLGDGQYDGQRHKVTMSDASTSSTLSITSHETSSPEVGTVADVGDSLLLEWDAINAYWWTVKNIGVAF